MVEYVHNATMHLACGAAFVKLRRISYEHDYEFSIQLSGKLHLDLLQLQVVEEIIYKKLWLDIGVCLDVSQSEKEFFSFHTWEHLDLLNLVQDLGKVWRFIKDEYPGSIKKYREDIK